MEHFCEVCFCWFDPGGTTKKVCSDECREARLKTRQTSIGTRFTALQRILRDEKIFWHDDRMIHSERFYEGLLSFGCIYCHASLEHFSGVCLDRMSNDGKHNSFNVAPCCPECNRIRSDVYTPVQAARLGKIIEEFRNEDSEPKRKSGGK